MNLKSLLEFYGLDTTRKIKVARHKDEKRGYDLPRLHQMGQLEIYQSYQEKSDFHGCDYLISFLGTDNNQAVLVGVFEVKGFRKASEVPLPSDFFYYDMYKPGRKYYYELEEVPGFEDLKDRLVINWSGGAINWVQRLDSREKEVVQLLPKGYVSHFPGYLNFILSHNQLKKSWRIRMLIKHGIKCFRWLPGFTSSLILSAGNNISVQLQERMVSLADSRCMRKMQTVEMSNCKN